MHTPVVHHQNAALSKSGQQGGFEKTQKGVFVDRVRYDQSLLSQRTLEGYRSDQTDPFFLAFGPGVVHPFTTCSPTVLTALPDVGACFIYKDKLGNVFLGSLFAVDLTFQLISLSGDEALFLCVISRRFK